jgi:hypothetical protein
VSETAGREEDEALESQFVDDGREVRFIVRGAMAPREATTGQPTTAKIELDEAES